MKKTLTLLILLFLSIQLKAQNCTQDAKAQFAKSQISKPGSSPVCANAAQFYAYLCECKNKPRTAQQAKNLKATLQQIKTDYNNYSSYCEGIGQITDLIPNCKVGNSNGSSTGGNSTPSSGYNQNENNTPDNAFESILREFDSQSYNNLSYANALQRQGQQIVDGLAQKVNRYSQLIETDDPAALLSDFQSKFSTIEDIQRNYNEQSLDFGLQRGEELANQINSGDYQGAFINSISSLSTLGEMREAEKELEQKKQALEQAKQNRMFEIYEKAWDSNNKLLDMYRERAAYAESPNDEQTNFNYVFYQVCVMNSMTDGINENRDDWYVNRCAEPKTVNQQQLKNNLISRDLQLLKVADRKYALYEKYDNRQIYLDAAISFTANAVKENPSAKNYFQLGKLYSESSNVLSLVSLESAKSIDTALFSNPECALLYDEVKKSTVDEVTNAVTTNDIDYLRSFVNVGLHQTIRLEGKTLFAFALTLDKPDAVQTILNHEATGLNQPELQKKLNQAVKLAAFLNASESISRIKNLGVAIPLEDGDENAIDYAVKDLSKDAIVELTKDTKFKNYFETKYVNHPVNVLLEAEKNAVLAAEKLDALDVNPAIEGLVLKMMEGAIENPEYLKTLGRSATVLSLIASQDKYNKQAKQIFLNEVIKPSPESKAAFLLDNGWIKFNTVPTVMELTGGITFKETNEEVVEPVSTEYKLKALIKNTESLYNRFAELGTQDPTTLQAITEFKEQLRKVNTLTRAEQDGINFLYLLNSFGELPKSYYQEAQKLYRLNHRPNENRKIEVLVQFLKSIQASMPTSISNDQIGLQIQMLRDKSPNYDANLETRYAAASFIQRLPMNKGSILRFNNTPSVNAQAQVDEEENIAVIAIQADNNDLFKRLDKEFDLSQVSSSDGLNLLEVVNEKIGALLDNKDFLSKDLSVEKLPKHKRNEIFRNQCTRFFDISDIYWTLEFFKESKNIKVSKTGGTLLHWMVDDIIDNYQDFYRINGTSPILELEIDQSIKDDNGMTAEAYLKYRGKPLLKKTKVRHTQTSADGTSFNYNVNTYIDPRGQEVKYFMDWFKGKD